MASFYSCGPEMQHFVHVMMLQSHANISSTNNHPNEASFSTINIQIQEVILAQMLKLPWEVAT